MKIKKKKQVIAYELKQRNVKQNHAWTHYQLKILLEKTCIACKDFLREYTTT